MGNTPFVIGLGVSRIKSDGMVVVFYGAGILEKMSMDIRAVDIGSHITWVKIQCLVIIQHCVLGSADMFVDKPPGDMGLSAFRGKEDSQIIVFKRKIVLP